MIARGMSNARPWQRNWQPPKWTPRLTFQYEPHDGEGNLSTRVLSDSMLLGSMVLNSSCLDEYEYKLVLHLIIENLVHYSEISLLLTQCMCTEQ